MLDTGVLRTVMSTKFEQKWNIEITLTERRFIAANGSSNSCDGIVRNFPLVLNEKVVGKSFMIMNKVLFDDVIGDLNQGKMSEKMDRDSHTVRFKLGNMSGMLILE